MHLKTLALMSALALASSSAAVAQPAPPPRDDQPMRMHRPDPAQMAERRTERLRTVLQLRPDQDGALRAYIGSMQPLAGARDRMRATRPQPGQVMTTPERLDRQAARMAEHQQRFTQHAAATKRFYAALSLAQQKAFDAMPQRGHGKGHGGKGRMRGPGGQRWHG